MEKAEENTPIEKPSRRWKDNFKINLKEISWEGVEQINQAQNKDNVLVSKEINILVTLHAGNLTI